MSKLEFIKTKNVDSPAAKLAKILREKLQQNKKVLLLLSGGSSVAVASKVLPDLNDSRLFLAQVDERYGRIDHKDSNWLKIKSALKINKKIKTFPVLKGNDFQTTISAYEETLQKLFNEVDFKIALLGIGADGHTAGILPGSPALESRRLVAGYKGPDFTRITITPRGIEELDAGIMYACGESKKQALIMLKNDEDANVQPAQLLKKIGNVYIFNDQIGREA